MSFSAFRRCMCLFYFKKNGAWFRFNMTKLWPKQHLKVRLSSVLGLGISFLIWFVSSLILMDSCIQVLHNIIQHQQQQTHVIFMFIMRQDHHYTNNNNNNIISSSWPCSSYYLIHHLKQQDNNTITSSCASSHHVINKQTTT